MRRRDRFFPAASAASHRGRRRNVDQRCGLGGSGAAGRRAAHASRPRRRNWPMCFQYVLGHRRTGGRRRRRTWRRTWARRAGWRSATGSDLRFRVIVLDDLVGAAADFLPVVDPMLLAPIAIAARLRRHQGGNRALRNRWSSIFSFFCLRNDLVEAQLIRSIGPSRLS